VNDHRLCSAEKTSGDTRLKAALGRHRRAARDHGRSHARADDPKPYDFAWGWWIEERITRLENGQTWLIRIAIGALVAEVLRIIMAATGLGS
jgi:hypothetical protein